MFGRMRDWPATQCSHNSIIKMIESQSRLINVMVGAVLDAKKKSKTLQLEPKQRWLEEYNKEIQEMLRTTNFADERCNSWYKTKEQNITDNWCGTACTAAISGMDLA